MCLLGSVAELWQFFLDVVISQSIERHRSAKSVLKIEPQSKWFDNAKRISAGRILAERTDNP
jgi:hypothetical protein